jgi:hypothetical protein
VAMALRASADVRICGIEQEDQGEPNGMVAPPPFGHRNLLRRTRLRGRTVADIGNKLQMLLKIRNGL